MKEFESVIQIKPRQDAFNDIRMEYAQMLKHQLAKGNNGLVRTKYITFGIEAENIREAKPKLERIETDILNNFKVLGVPAYPLDGKERLQIFYETFNPDETVPFQFSYDQVLRSGMGTKDFVAPTSFVFKNGRILRWAIPLGLCPICRSWPGADRPDAGGIFGYGQKSDGKPPYPVHRPDESDQTGQKQSNGHQPHED